MGTKDFDEEEQTKPSARKRPHEERIIANYAKYLEAPTPREQEKLMTLMYKDLVSIVTAVFIQKYGFSVRIDMESVVHMTVSSALMTVIQRKKEVHSWVQLLKKMLYDNTNKWMGSNLYGNSGIKLVGLEIFNQEDEESSSEHFLPHYDMGYENIHFLNAYIKQVAGKIVEILKPLYDSTKGTLLSILVIEAASGKAVDTSVLPNTWRFRFNYYLYRLKPLFDSVLNPKKLEAALF